MTLQITPSARLVTRPSDWRIVATLAGPEAGRMLRNPLVLLGLLLSGLFAWTSLAHPQDWTGARYTTVPILLSPMLLAISLVVAESFHRERSPISADSPTLEQVRAGGRLVASFALVGLVAAIVIAGATYFAMSGGLDLGDEPGRTLHAQFTLPELAQHVALAVLAVALGAAAGRRLRHRASASLVLFLAWFPVGFVSWAFQAPSIVPFSIIQIQPVNVEVASGDTDPLTLPTWWLLSGPGEFQDSWDREFTSVALGAWHDAWLLGLACLLTAVAVPGRWRVTLLVTGSVVAAVSILAQYAVIP